MKYKVIGWTSFDDDALPNGEATFGAQNAILDEIRKKEFEFTGWDHQNSFAGVPVLNNGYKYCYTTRGWGALMAEAHGYTGYFDYSNYSFGSLYDERKHPDWVNEDDYDLDDIEKIEDIAETFTINISEETAKEIKETKRFKTTPTKSKRYIDAHDKVLFKTPVEEFILTIKSAHKDSTLSDDDLYFVHSNIGNSATPKNREKAQSLWSQAKPLLSLEFE